MWDINYDVVWQVVMLFVVWSHWSVMVDDFNDVSYGTVIRSDLWEEINSCNATYYHDISGQLGNDTTYDTEKRTRHHMMSPTRRPCRADVLGRHNTMSSKPTADDI